MIIVTQTLAGLVYLGIAFGYLYLAKRVTDLLVDYNADEQIEEKSNLAVALRRSGLYLGTVIGLYGALNGPSAGFGSDVGLLLLDGAILTIFMIVVRNINDSLIVYGINNDNVVRGGNVAVGLVECGGYIATGVIALASFSGAGGGIVNSIVFFVLGQLSLLLVTRVYESITPFNTIQQIRENNASAGLMVGGIMIALSIVLYGAIAGDSGELMSDLINVGISAVIGIGILMSLTHFIDWIFLPNTDLETEIVRDRNVAAIAVTISVKIALAFMIAGAVI